MPQTARIPTALWEAQRARITELYVSQDKTLDEVIQIMDDSGFHATKPQYIRKVNVNWKLQKNYTKEKWQHASALVGKRQAEGKLTKLSIDGKVISEKRQKKELRRYHVLQVEEEFVSPSAYGVVACTPPSSNSRVVLVNGLPWLKFRESLNDLIKSQPPLFGPSQQNGPFVFSKTAYPLLSGAHTSGEMAIGSMPLIEPPRSVSEQLSKPLDIKEQRVFGLVPMLDNSMEVLRHQEPPWLHTFNSLVFLCSNNLMRTESYAYELLHVAISSGFLIKMKNLFTMRSPALEIFARHLLFVALEVQGSKGTEFLRFLLESGVSPDSFDPDDYGLSALQKGMRVMNRDAVQLLLQYGADPDENVECTEDDTPQSSLRSGDDSEITRVLVEYWGDVNSGYEELLLQAVKHEDLALIKPMLEAGADLKMLPAEGLSVLYFAIDRWELSLVNILIEAGVSTNLLIDELYDEDIEFLENEFEFHYGTSILTPLQHAVLSRNAGIVMRLIEGGAVMDTFIDPEMLNKMDGNLSSSKILTPLQVSVQERQHEITRILLDAGAGVDFRHPATGTALQLACGLPKRIREKTELIKALLAKGANINSLPGEPAGRTAMQAAAESGDLDLLKLLLTRGGNPFASVAKKDGLTVFQAALKSCSAELVTYVFWELVNSCTCFSFFDETNYLEEAVSTGNIEILETVLKLWNHHGRHWPKGFISSALKTAVRRGFIYRILGPDAESTTIRSLTIPNEEVSSLICELIWTRDVTMFDFLMQHFIKPNLDFAQSGYPTPLWLAMHQGENYLAKRLLHAGANPNKPSLVVCRNKYKECCHDTGSEMPLKQAICRFDNELLELLTNKGASIHCLIDRSLTPLLVSLQKRNESAAAFLLSKGADPNVVDVSGRYTALGFALNRVASLSTLQVLIEHGSDVNMTSVWGTPLEQVARGDFQQNDTMQRCQLLLAAGADVNASKTGMTALQVAVQENNTELAKLLVEVGASLSTSSVQTSVLQQAVSRNNLELAALFLAIGADVDASAMEKTPLKTAASLGNLEMVKLLVDRGADVDTKSPGRTTALQYAAKHGSVEIVKYLVEHGASVNEEASPFYKATALGLAVANNHTQTAMYLIEKGSSVNENLASYNDCPTILQLAAIHGNHEIVTRLVENGATVNVPPGTGRGATALQCAAINGDIKMAVLLLENGAQVSAKGAIVDGRTALEGAAEHGRLDMVYLLLDNDEEPDTIEERCCNAAEFAEAEHHDVIARILRNYKRP